MSLPYTVTTVQSLLYPPLLSGHPQQWELGGRGRSTVYHDVVHYNSLGYCESVSIYKSVLVKEYEEILPHHLKLSGWSTAT